jgi:serine/threonine protein kinase/tetratricopeptide (TPR) repeat protein
MTTSEEIFERAIRLPTPQERAAYVRGACGDNHGLREQVQSLIEAHEEVGRFMPTDPGEAGITVPDCPLLDAEGTRVGRYKLLQRIGEGGMGIVYMAEQEEPVRRRVALKIIKLGMDTKQVVARFEAERQALALMDHPNIAKVLDGGATETGRPYFVMELVQGVPITDFCDKGKLSAKDRLKLFLPVCQAIQSAHQKGVIHRDIKPSNVLVTLHDGVPVPKVIDFGIAKATNQKLTEKTLFTNFATMIGTPAYMSPEQAEMSGLDIDTRTDIYALGVLLYELLTGTTPFPEKRLRSLGYGEMQRVIADEEPERPSTRLSTMENEQRTLFTKNCGEELGSLSNLLKGDLDWIVMKCLEKDRQRRYETANGLAMDLQRHLGNEPVVARPPSMAYRLQKLMRRNRLAFAAGMAVAASLVVGIAASMWQAVRATRAEKRTAETLKQVSAERDAKELARQDAEAITTFLTEVFESPDPARNGRIITVAEMLDKAAKKLETDPAIHPGRRARLQATLGSTYYALGLYREAIQLQEKVRDHYASTLGWEHADTLSAAQNLAGSYSSAGRWDEALKLREEVLTVRRKVLGPEHLDTLFAMTQLAPSYGSAGRQDEALRLHEEVLTLHRKVLGPEHPRTLGAMENLARSLFNRRRRGEALRLWEELLPLRRKVLGPEHPDTLVTMGNLAGSYLDAGRLDEACKLSEQVLTLRRKVLGPEHPDTLTAMLSLASSYFDAGRLDEACKLSEQVLTLHRKVLGTEHPRTLAAMSFVASLYADIGRLDEALKLREEVLNLSRKVLGSEHPNTLWVTGLLADSYFRSNRREDALKLREEVLLLCRKVLGSEHPNTLDATERLAESYFHSNRREDALKLREGALPLFRKVLGPEHLDTLGAMSNLAISYATTGRREEALGLREEVLRLYRKVRGSEHPDTLWAMNSLASSYFDVGRWDEALKLRDEISEKKPEDTYLALQLAASQLWFGRAADYATTVRRMLNWARNATNANGFDRVAKMACLRATDDIPTREAILALARKAVHLGKENDPDMTWFQIALGMAEYRSGHYAETIQALTAAEAAAAKLDNERMRAQIIGTAALYRAMSLFRQGQAVEARTLFIATESVINPVPAGSAIKGDADHDDLILWMACKEARTLLQLPGAAANQPQP